jgi:hypothetical protein
MVQLTSSRRRLLKAAGASLTAVVIAGCSGSNGDDEETDDDQDDDDGGDDSFEIEPGATIMLEGNTGGWEGIEPSEIEGEENPTLVLEEGETYEIGWEQGDGSRHNVVLWDESQSTVEDYATDLTDSPDGTLEFTATEEIVYYRCEPHSSMQGEIRVE